MVSTSLPVREAVLLGRWSATKNRHRPPIGVGGPRSTLVDFPIGWRLPRTPSCGAVGSLKRLPVSDHGDLVSLTPPHQQTASATAPQTAVEQRAAADRQLVEACLARDDGDHGWEALVTQFSGLVAHVVSRTAEHRQRPLSATDRDDLVAEVFFEVLRNNAAVLRGFAGRSSLAAYLTVIARRVAGRRLQRLARSQVVQASQPASSSLEPHAVADGGGQRQVDDREQVVALLKSLDADEAKIVRLFHIEERSYGEISRLLGIPLGSVGPVLARARAKLRRQAG